MAALCLVIGVTTSVVRAAESAAAQCIAPISYLPLDPADVGLDGNGVADLGTYERISPDGRFILRSYSGALLGRVTLIELPAIGSATSVKVFGTPFNNEAFPVQGTWRYLVDVNGEHYRFSDVLRRQREARPLFRGGMTGFYAAASELSAADLANASSRPSTSSIYVRSLSWPQSADPDLQGVGPLQVATLEIKDDGQSARVLSVAGPDFICGSRRSSDGGVYALPMISVDGAEFSAIPEVPRAGKPSMRVYGLDPDPRAKVHACDLRADLGFSPGKAVFGYGHGARAWLTYSDLGHVYVYDRELGATFRLEHARHRVLASAFPGLTRDGRVIFGATWRDCPQGSTCPERAGYVIVDPYQSAAYRNYWSQQGKAAPKACITTQDVERERARFSAFHGLTN